MASHAGGDQITLALIALIGTSIAALVYTIKNNAMGKGIAKDAAQVNASVNHKDTGELSLYRLADANTRKLDQVIAKQEAFDKAWGNLPPGMDDAVGLVEVLHALSRDVQQVRAAIAAHVEWEEGVKWPSFKHDPTEPR